MSNDDDLFVEVDESEPSGVNVDPNRHRSTSVPMSKKRRGIVIVFTVLAITFLCAAVMYSSGSEREDIIMLFILGSGMFCFGAVCAWLGRRGRTRIDTAIE